MACYIGFDKNYAVQDLEKALAEFPALLQEIEMHSPARTND